MNQSDQSGNARSENTPAQTEEIQMRLLGQYLKDVSFESPNAPEVLTKLRDKPDMNIEMNTRNHKVDRGFEVELSIKASCSYGEMQGYVADVTYAAVVAISDGADDQIKALILNVEIPQLLFPYVRAILSDLTAQGSFKPLVMRPVDFRHAFAKRIQAEAAKAKALDGDSAADELPRDND